MTVCALWYSKSFIRFYGKKRAHKARDFSSQKASQFFFQNIQNENFKIKLTWNSPEQPVNSS